MVGWLPSVHLFSTPVNKRVPKPLPMVAKHAVTAFFGKAYISSTTCFMLFILLAVPAVMGYNWLIRRNKTAMERVRTFSGDLHNVLLAGKR